MGKYIVGDYVYIKHLRARGLVVEVHGWLFKRYFCTYWGVPPSLGQPRYQADFKGHELSNDRGNGLEPSPKQTIKEQE